MEHWYSIKLKKLTLSLGHKEFHMEQAEVEPKSAW